VALSLGDVTLFFNADPSGVKKGMDQVQQSVAATTKQVGMAMTAMGAAITGALGLAVNSAVKFGGAMAEINTLGVKQLDELEDGIKRISTTFGTDLVETAKGAYQVISATGTDGAEAIGLLEAATKAATAGVSSVTAAVELGTGVMNAFGLQASDINTIYDQAFVAVKNGVTTFDELAASVGKVAPVMSAAGLSSDEMFASVAALTKAGIKTSEAVTGMKGALTNIIKPGSDATKAAEEMGIQFDVSALKSQGLSGFMQQISTAAGGNVEQMSRLFPSVEALNAVLALSGSQAQSFASTLDEMRGGTFGVDEAFAKFAERDPGMAFRQLKAELAVLSVEVGEALLPALKGILDVVTPVVKAIVEWAKEHPGLTQGLVMVTGALGALMLVLGPLLILMPGIVAVMGLFAGPAALGGVATAATAATGAAAGGGILGLVAALGPLAIIIAGGIAWYAFIKGALSTMDAFDQLGESQARLTGQMDAYVRSLQERGIVADQVAMAEMSHAEQRAYLADLEKQSQDTLARAHLEHYLGRMETEQEYAQARNLMLNDNLTAEEAAKMVSLGISENRLREIMQMDQQETETLLDAMGLRADGALRGDLAITDSAIQAAGARQEAYINSANNIVTAEGQATSMIGRMWQGLWNTVSSWFGGGAPEGFAGGGRVSSGGRMASIIAGERGPELADFPGGGSALLRGPGLFTVPVGTFIHTAQETMRGMASEFVGAFAGGGLVLSNKQKRELRKFRKNFLMMLLRAWGAGRIGGDEYQTAFGDVGSWFSRILSLEEDKGKPVDVAGVSARLGGQMRMAFLPEQHGGILESLNGKLNMRNVPGYALGGTVGATGARDVVLNINMPGMVVRQEADIDMLSNKLAARVRTGLMGAIG